MENVYSLLSSRLDDPSCRFVFPSQVAADFWRRKVLDLSGRKALRWDRFLSWDSFKENQFVLSRKDLPSNSRIRRCFCADLLDRFRRGEAEFSVLVNPLYRETSGVFQGFLASVLPHLKGFWEGPGRDPRGLDPALLGDLHFLYASYREFLASRGFFEPAWENPEPGTESFDCLLFFPELLEDYREFRSELSLRGRIREITLAEAGASAAPAEEGSDPAGRAGTAAPGESGNTREAGEGLQTREKIPLLSVYSDSREEVESFCLSAGALLDGGADGNSIAVTLADPDLMPLLLRSADRYGLPLSFRSGTPLGETAEGRLFGRIRACGQENFSLASLKDLLLNRAYPWKGEETIRRLLAFGAEHHCLRNLAASPGEKPRDLWEEMFRLAERSVPEEEGPAIRELREFYVSFRNGIRKLTSADSFAGLSRALELFFRQFMDTDLWDPRGLPVLQRVRRSLGELRLLEERLTGLARPSVLDFFIQDLNSRTYVSQEEAPGIAVYAYRVSAGILPEHHFVLGLSQRACRVVNPLFPFLREDQRSLLALEERDQSQAFLGAYCASGVRVHLSCALASPAGPELPAGFFVVQGRLAAPEGRERGVLRKGDPYLREELYWAGQSDTLPESLAPLQHRGLAAAGDLVCTAPPLDLTREPLGEGPLLDRFLREASTEEGLLRVTSYRLDGREACPFAHFLSQGLGLESLSHEAWWSDPLSLGNLRHQVLFRFFTSLEGAPLEPERREEYRERMIQAAGESFRYWEVREPLSGIPFWHLIRRQVTREVLGFLDTELAEFPGCRVFELEAPHRQDRPEEGISLAGRLDRVSRMGARLLLVDYKSSQPQGEKGMIDPEGRPFSYQMPLYTLLLEGEGHRVEGALYYDFKKNRYAAMMQPDDSASRERMEKAVEATEEAVAAYRKTLNGGDFRPPEECDSCPFRRICRQKFMVGGPIHG